MGTTGTTGTTGASGASYLGEAGWSLGGATQRSLCHWSGWESQGRARGEYLELTGQRGWWLVGGGEPVFDVRFRCWKEVGEDGQKMAQYYTAITHHHNNNIVNMKVRDY